MRIAAGVLLILVALMNGCTGAAVTILGGAASAIGSGVETAADEGATEAATTEDAEAAKAVSEGASEIKSVGGMLVLFGTALLVLFGLQLAASICLFATKAARFVVVVGGIGVIVPLLFHFTSDSSNLIYALVCAAISGLAAFAGHQMGQEGAGGAMAPPPPETA